ncbi:hypothetical protein AX14_006504 [Amanita brunnescens Koide BX004]|nr:hypothetical protein AX14_006504 [Amanita brunnescens Koide BX004]
MHSSPQPPAPALMLSLAALEALLSPAPPVTPAIPARSLLSTSDAQSLQPAPLNWPLLTEPLPDGAALSPMPSPVSMTPVLITAVPLLPPMLSFLPVPTAPVCQAPHAPAAPPSLPAESALLQTPLPPAVSLAALLPHTLPATVAALIPSQPHPLAPSILPAAHIPLIHPPPVPDDVPPVSNSSLALLAKARLLPCPPPVAVITPALKLPSPTAQQMLPALPVVPPLPPPAQVPILLPPPLPDGLLATPDEKAFRPIRKGPILAVTDVVTALPMSLPQLQLPSLPGLLCTSATATHLPLLPSVIPCSPPDEDPDANSLFALLPSDVLLPMPDALLFAPTDMGSLPFSQNPAVPTLSDAMLRLTGCASLCP